MKKGTPKSLKTEPHKKAYQMLGQKNPTNQMQIATGFKYASANKQYTILNKSNATPVEVEKKSSNVWPAVNENLHSKKSSSGTFSYSAMLRKNIGNQPAQLPIKQELEVNEENKDDKYIEKRRQLKEKKKLKKKLKKKRATEKETPNQEMKQTEMPIKLDISNVVNSLLKTNRSDLSQSKKKKTKRLMTMGTVSAASLRTSKQSSQKVAAISAKPIQLKRGKVREKPRKKRLSILRQIILASRKQRQSMNHTTDADKTRNNTVAMEIKDEKPGNHSSISLDNENANEGSKVTKEYSPEVNPSIKEISNDKSRDDVAADEDSGKITPSPPSKVLKSCNPLTALPPAILKKIHSRKFREYCDHLPCKDIDINVEDLLSTLMRFQDRVYHENPAKFQQKKRLVQGLREVRRSLRVNKLKCVILAPNLERVPVEGGIDDYIGQIIDVCHTNNLPIIYSMPRQKLGKILRKKVPVSAVGILSYDGAQDQFKRIIELVENAKEAYSEKVKLLQAEAGLLIPSGLATDCQTAENASDVKLESNDIEEISHQLLTKLQTK